MSENKIMLTVPEVAEMLRLSVTGVYGLVEQRKIPHVKVSNRVRFFHADVIAWLQENRVSAIER